MRKLHMIIGMGMMFLLFIGLGQVNGQRRNITYTTVGTVASGQTTITVQFNIFPSALEGRMEDALNENEQMFSSYKIVADDKAVTMDLAYEDMSLDDLRGWLDTYVKVWNKELHEDLLHN